MSTPTTNPFELPGEWLKCALHTHSTESDGTLAPRHLVQSYAEAGFDVVAITDHWRRTVVPSTDRLITIPSAELGFDLKYPGYPRQSGEFLVYGISDLPDDPGGNRDNWMFNAEENWEARTFASLSAAMQWSEAHGAVSYVAHPYWNELSIDDLLESEGFAGIEVFNGSAEVENGRGDSSTWWDVLLRNGRRTFGIATDDQHYPLFELGLAWTMLHVVERTPEAVIEALRTGQAYFSHGPSIFDIALDGDAVEVTCSPARSVILHMEQECGVSVSVGANGRRMGQILATDDAGLITRVRLEPDQASPKYRRVSVIDKYGKRAWSNPL
ncbi:MAG: CehA/McbA family metallohydrolase [Actinomycetes bacterium]